MDHISNQLTKMENLDVAKSTTSQELTTEESSLKTALADKRVRDLSEKEFKAMMLYIYTLIGLRGENYPAGIEKDFIHAYIRESYGGHTSQEIRLAFTMAIQCKLEVDATVFEHFTTSYFSRILESYRKWAKQAIEHIKPHIPELPPVQVSDDEFIESVFALYKINNNWKLIPEMAYRVLESKLNLSKDEKKRIFLQVSQTTNDKEKMPELSRQYAVKEFFDIKIKNDDNRV